MLQFDIDFEGIKLQFILLQGGSCPELVYALIEGANTMLIFEFIALFLRKEATINNKNKKHNNLSILFTTFASRNYPLQRCAKRRTPTVEQQEEITLVLFLKSNDIQPLGYLAEFLVAPLDNQRVTY